MDVGCWGVTSDHQRDYCCLVGGLDFQHLDADFSTLKTCFTGDKFKRRCFKLLFRQEQLNGEKVKREWLCSLPSSKHCTALFANFLGLILKKIMLASVGCGDWKHAPRDLARHGSSNKHLSYLLTYIFRRTKKVSICKNLEEQKELAENIGTKYWHKF